MEKVLIAGGTGLIGKEITKQLINKNYIVHILSRSKHENKDRIHYFQWDIEKNWIEDGAIEVDHVINLTGAGIADSRWTDKRKKIIVDSRVNSTAVLRNHIKNRNFKLKSFTSASAIGYYGDSGDVWVDEKSEPVDTGFLSTVTVNWEKAAETLRPFADRLNIIRVGIVFDENDGAFAKMLIPFKLRMASYFGDGSMYYSWIHIDDIAGIFTHAVVSSNMNGIYNGVADEVVTNKELVKRMKEIKSGFHLLNAVPKFALRTAMGEMADVVLTSNRVKNDNIKETGYTFNFPKLDGALKDLL